ncbi:CotY/CotZ family spore coat protein [Fervidibacillus halotolerans]|uniref:CotY/CotZ family spore coat protein n=1 Tax=Fervidibacillus halotolerans TaxID=2980027 RepID=A0A9E8M1F6_9BACI|nr:CotY/CotZ family spore coat protein [Fervidibacillus halotolerans]WAA13130.1 CotY/CotZ family spore coat protein [Fervidibacillus halotolerans]
MKNSPISCYECVRDTLKEILQYQRESEEICKNGCEVAINELLNPSVKRKNTIPFILYTKDGCPFKSDGVTTFRCKCCNEVKYHCFTTFLFRIKGLKKDCAILELLAFKHEDDCSCSMEACNPYEQIDCENVKDLYRTGIYIKVDPSCFCSISCLPPINLFS